MPSAVGWWLRLGLAVLLPIVLALRIVALPPLSSEQAFLAAAERAALVPASAAWASVKPDGVYQPLADSFFRLEHGLFEGDAAGYRGVSVGLAVATGLAAWAALGGLGLRGAWLISLLLVLHPVVAPARLLIDAQPAALGGVLALAALALFFRLYGITAYGHDPEADWRPVRARGSRAGWLLVLLLYVAACLCTPAATWLPAVAALAIVWRFGGAARQARPPALMALALLALAGGAAAIGAGGKLDSLFAGDWQPAAAWLGALPPGILRQLAQATASDATSVPLAFSLTPGRAVGAGVLVVLLLGCGSSGRPLLRTAAALGTLFVLNVTATLTNVSLLGAEVMLPASAAGGAVLVLLIVVVEGGLLAARRVGPMIALKPGRPERFAARLLAGGALAACGVAFAFQGRACGAETGRWEQTARRFPDSSLVRLRQADALFAARRPAEAGAVLRAISSTDRALEVGIVTRLQSAGLFAQAESRLSAAVGREPRSEELQLRLGETLLQQGKPREASVYFTAALAANPESEAAAIDLAVALFQTGDPNRAVETLNAAVEAHPGSVRAHLNLANYYRSAGRLFEASEHLLASVTADPDNYAATTAAAAVLLQSGRGEEAEALYRQAIGINPAGVEAYDGLGLALAFQQRLDEAFFFVKKALSIEPTHSAALLHQQWLIADIAASAKAPTANHGEGR